MSLKLFNFAYNTLLQQADQQSSKLFLPKVLAAMKDDDNKPYLPKNIAKWSIPKIKDSSGTISDAFAAAWFPVYFGYTVDLSQEQANPPSITQKMIDDAGKAVKAIYHKLSVQPCPGSSSSLAVKDIQIQGLANIKVSGDAPRVTQNDTSYICDITLDLNAYPAVQGEDWNRPLALGGTEEGKDSNTQMPFVGLGFSLTQCLCFMKNGTTDKCVPRPDGVSQPVSPINPNGFAVNTQGQADIAITNAKIIANITIEVSSDKKALDVTVNTLKFMAKTGTLPIYTAKHVGIATTERTKDFADPWAQFFKSTLSLPDAQKGFTTQINTALNTSNNKTTIQKAINSQFTNALNNLFGVQGPTFNFQPGGSSDSNEVDQYLFYRAGYALNSSSSNFYLPKLILGVTSPVLEPYTTSAIDINQHVGIDSPVKITLSEMKLPSGLKLAGLSNLIAPPGSVTFGTVAHASFELGRLNPGPTINNKKVPNPPMAATSTFSTYVQVANNNPIGPLTGNISITVKTAGAANTPGVQTVLTASGGDPASLVLTYTEVILLATPEEIDINISLDGSGAAYESFIKAIANQPELKNIILAAINDKIKGDLHQISSAATTFVKKQLTHLG